MSLLKELSLDDNTLVIFASDNGAAYRDELFNHSGPLRGYKRDMYEGGLRTPAVARMPGRIKPGTVSEQVWTFCDFLPTMAELVGSKTPAGLDGVSILPAFFRNEVVKHPPLYFEFHERGFTQAARIDNWKAVRPGLDKPLELYDLQSDLAESHDIASEHQEVVRDFEAFFASARVESEQWPMRKSATKGKKAKAKVTTDE
jgi:arylsulfatase A